MVVDSSGAVITEDALTNMMNPAGGVSAAQAGSSNASATLASAAPQASATGAAASTIDLTKLAAPTAATAEQQLSGILNKNSTLMQSAASSGQRAANARGLLNSSMGVQAAQQAVLNTATPIATADASSINSVNLSNAQQQNAALTANAGLTTDVSKTNAALTTDVSKTNQAQQNALALQNAQLATQTAQQNAQSATDVSKANAALATDAAKSNQAQANATAQFNAQQANAQSQFNASQQNEAFKQFADAKAKQSLAQVEADYKTLMQSNQSAASMYAQFLASIQTIGTSSVSDAAKSTAIDNMTVGLQNGMEMIQAMEGITGLVTFSAGGGAVRG